MDRSGPSMQCGVASKSSQMAASARIFNGEAAAPHSWPWMTMILKQDYNKRNNTLDWAHICGGSLLNHNSILTAAHCIDILNPQFYKIALGKHESQLGDGSEFVYEIQSIIKHSKFRSSDYENDIAILKSKIDILYNEYIRPICLPDPSKDIIGASSTASSSCFVIGWGHMNLNPDPTNYIRIHRPVVLQQSLMKVMHSEACFNTQSELQLGFSFAQESNRLCAAKHFEEDDITVSYGGIEMSNRGAACQGDSGGPLFCLDIGDDGYKIQGIVSLGAGCGRRGLHTRVSSYMEWILINM